MIKHKIRVETRTHGLWLTGAAAALGLAVIVATGVTATEAGTAIRPLMVIAGLMHVCALVLGSARWVGATSAPLLAAIVLESGFSDEPSWLRSIVLGCSWFVALELSWEAIDRRSGVRYTSAATLRRLHEVVTVVVVSLIVGLVASSARSLAPVRTVALQAVVLGALLVAFVSLVRHVVSSGPESEFPRPG